MKWDDELAEWGFKTTAEYVPPKDATDEYYVKVNRGPKVRRTATGHGMVFEAEAYGDACTSRLYKLVKEWKQGHPEAKPNQALGLVITQDDRSVKFEHPAYGAISISRFMGRGQLFDTKVRETYGGVSIRICEAEHVHSAMQGVYDGNPPRVHGAKQLIELRMSMSQWGEFVASTGGGSIPCTISFHPEHGSVSMPEEAHQNHQDAVRISAKRRMEQATSEIRTMLAELEGSMKGPGPLKASEKQELWGRIERFARRITEGMPYLGKQFDEAMQESLAEARVELRTNAAEIQAIHGGDAAAALPDGGPR